MSKLSGAGLVEIEKTFADNRPRTLYRLTDRGRSALAAYKRDLTILMEALPD